MFTQLLFTPLKFMITYLVGWEYPFCSVLNCIYLHFAIAWDYQMFTCFAINLRWTRLESHALLSNYDELTVYTGEWITFSWRPGENLGGPCRANTDCKTFCILVFILPCEFWFCFPSPWSILCFNRVVVLLVRQKFGRVELLLVCQKLLCDCLDIALAWLSQ